MSIHDLARPFASLLFSSFNLFQPTFLSFHCRLISASAPYFDSSFDRFRSARFSAAFQVCFNHTIQPRFSSSLSVKASCTRLPPVAACALTSGGPSIGVIRSSRRRRRSRLPPPPLSLLPLLPSAPRCPEAQETLKVSIASAGLTDCTRRLREGTSASPPLFPSFHSSVGSAVPLCACLLAPSFHRPLALTRTKLLCTSTRRDGLLCRSETGLTQLAVRSVCRARTSGPAVRSVCCSETSGSATLCWSKADSLFSG